jgi:RNA-binding protein 26
MPEQGLINPMMNMPGVQPGQQPPFPMHGMPNAQHPNFMMPGHQSGFPMGMQGPPGGWTANGNGVSPQQQGMPGISGGAGNGAEGGFDLGARLGAQQAPTEAPFYDGGAGFRGGARGGRGGSMGRGGARGTFEKRATSNTTLVIENVPVENLDLIKINEYFKKFGTITNIQIDVDSKKALVSYSQPAEAKAAHTSPEVIFNNRFVKVYFQKLDDPGIGAPKLREVPAAPPLKNNFIPGQTSNKFVRPDLANKAKEAQSAASQKLDALMSQQKVPSQRRRRR